MLFFNAHIMPMDKKDIQSGYVRVENGVIVSIGPMQDCPPCDYDKEEAIDLQGKKLLPGFIDAHTHLGMYGDGMGFEGDDINEESDPCTPHLRAIDSINPMDRCFSEALAGGITCAVIGPGSANALAGQICAIKTNGRWVDEMAIKAPLAIKFALGENPKMVYSAKNQGPYTRMATAAIIREQLHKAKRYMLDKQSAMEDPEIDEPEYDIRCEALIPLLKGEIRAHFHVHKAYDILTAVRIAEEFALNYTLIHCTEGYLIADILGKLSARVVCGPMICSRTKPELTGLTMKNCAALVNAGAIVAIATDFPEVPSELIATSAALANTSGLSHRQALESITINAARAVDLDNRLGSITVGKDADLLVFDGDPLALDVQPLQVYVGGKKVI